MKSSMFKILAILICVTALTASPVLGGPDADTLDDLDSTDFARATHAHSTSDVTGLDAELATKAEKERLVRGFRCRYLRGLPGNGLPDSLLAHEGTRVEIPYLVA